MGEAPKPIERNNMWLHEATLLAITSGIVLANEEQKEYVTYHPGTLPIIIAAPHGGSIEPDDVADRDAGCWDGDGCIWSHSCGVKDSSKCKATTVTDMFTKELALQLRQELHSLYEAYPPTVICELKRSKMDANRDLAQAAFGISSMERAWTQFHSYINHSKPESTSKGSLFIDIHGHGHKMQWAELGYLIKGPNLDNGSFTSDATSIRRLADSVEVPFEELLRGPLSFGGILEAEGFEAVPSFTKKGPGGNRYYSGGDNTRMHGSLWGGSTDAIQIESPSSFRSEEQRPLYAKALARTIQRYMELYYDFPGKMAASRCAENGPRSLYVLPALLLLTSKILKPS